MSEKVFGPAYADQYDLLYREKDYEAECDLIEEVFRRYGEGDVKSILDLGCGTGNHAIPLARRGYQVTGVDLSADMLVHAKEKSTGVPLSKGVPKPAFIQSDVRSVDLGQQFDAVLMMFAVLGYQLTNEDVLDTLCTVRRHLKPGGLFLSDVWYGPAVLAIRPGDRVKITSIDGGKVIRAASGQLDVYNHWADVHYHIWRLSDQQIVSESEETHRMRYFFPQELFFFAKQAQLRLTGMWSFGDLGKLPNESTWNAMFVAHVLPQKESDLVR